MADNNNMDLWETRCEDVDWLELAKGRVQCKYLRTGRTFGPHKK